VHLTKRTRKTEQPDATATPKETYPVQVCYPQLAPAGPDSAGEVLTTYYVVNGKGLVILTDEHGAILKDKHGATYTANAEGNARKIAARMALARHRSRDGAEEDSFWGASLGSGWNGWR
jgi:hypothetical protein